MHLSRSHYGTAARVRSKEDEDEGKFQPGIDVSTMRKLLEGLLRNMRGGVFATDMKKRIILFNKAAVWLTGYCLEDVLGKTCQEVFQGNCCENSCLFSKVTRGEGIAYKDNVLFFSKEKQEIPVNITAFSLKDKNNKTIGMVGIFRDLFELKSLQGQLMHSDKLAIMGQLAAGVAHEINNPISGILTYIKFLLKKLQKEELSEKDVVNFRKYLSVMERETAHIGRTVKNLLDFSKRTEPDIHPLDINEVLEQSVMLLADQCKVGNVVLKREGRTSLPQIMGDFGQLQQVFINILMNAIHAMPDGGRIRIRTAAEGRPGGECFITVEISDNGVGIPKKDLKKIFDPFFTTKGGKDNIGLGLGLTIVQGIVKTHHGRIDVKSRPKRGTKFTIKLPTL
jgi:PAS domain S-box-containing protein